MSMVLSATDADWNGVPMEEHHAVTELFAEGIERIEVIGGENLRFIFRRWQYRDARWTRVGTDFAVILPRNAIPVELISGVRTVRPPQRPALTVSATRQ
jgi:hypothetical protein